MRSRGLDLTQTNKEKEKKKNFFHSVMILRIQAQDD
jgi:hypothetical protein